MNNKNYCLQYENPVTVITDGLMHKQAESVIRAKIQAGLLHEAVLRGYKDCVAGVYDKWWRYFTTQESLYLQGVQAAINNGACVETYIECPIAFA